MDSELIGVTAGRHRRVDSKCGLSLVPESRLATRRTFLKARVATTHPDLLLSRSWYSSWLVPMQLTVAPLRYRCNRTSIQMWYSYLYGKRSERGRAHRSPRHTAPTPTIRRGLGTRPRESPPGASGSRSAGRNLLPDAGQYRVRPAPRQRRHHREARAGTRDTDGSDARCTGCSRSDASRSERDVSWSSPF